MNVNDYQKQARRSMRQDLDHSEMLLNACMGLNGEAGECIDLLKKHLFHGHDLDKEKLILELGDVAWYLAEAASALEIDLSEVLEKNIDKLKKRYPEGFDFEHSIHRNEN